MNTETTLTLGLLATTCFYVPELATVIVVSQSAKFFAYHALRSLSSFDSPLNYRVATNLYVITDLTWVMSLVTLQPILLNTITNTLTNFGIDIFYEKFSVNLADALISGVVTPLIRIPFENLINGEEQQIFTTLPGTFVQYSLAKVAGNFGKIYEGFAFGFCHPDVPTLKDALNWGLFSSANYSLAKWAQDAYIANSLSMANLFSAPVLNSLAAHSIIGCFIRRTNEQMANVYPKTFADIFTASALVGTLTLSYCAPEAIPYFIASAGTQIIFSYALENIYGARSEYLKPILKLATFSAIVLQAINIFTHNLDIAIAAQASTIYNQLTSFDSKHLNAVMNLLSDSFNSTSHANAVIIGLVSMPILYVANKIAVLPKLYRYDREDQPYKIDMSATQSSILCWSSFAIKAQLTGIMLNEKIDYFITSGVTGFVRGAYEYTANNLGLPSLKGLFGAVTTGVASAINSLSYTAIGVVEEPSRIVRYSHGYATETFDYLLRKMNTYLQEKHFEENAGKMKRE